MRELDTSRITDAVRELCIKANKVLPCSMDRLVREGADSEQSELGKSVFHDLCANLDAAQELNVPICQDTGMAVVFLELGQDVHLTGAPLEDAVNEGVRRGYVDGLLRLSIVKDPLRRVNTGDNTPAVIHTRIVPGDKVSVTVAPKGFGSENMSAMRMFTPAAGAEDVIQFVVDTVSRAGSNPCPPDRSGRGTGRRF